MAALYWLGGMGVGEGSPAVAAALFVFYVIQLVIGAIFGQPPGILALIAAGLLIGNVRAALIAGRWKARGEVTERFSDRPLDKIVNGIPSRLWPIGRWLFFPLLCVALALLCVGSVVQHRRASAATAAAPPCGTLDR